MVNYRRTKKSTLFFGAVACCALLTVSRPAGAYAAESSSDEMAVTNLLRIYGTISREGDRVMLNNIQGDTNLDILVLNLSDETRILDALNGYPMAPGSLKDGEAVYAYISPAMALSMPPQSHAETIICQIPAGFAAPSYETVSKVTGSNESGWQLTTKRGMVYGIDSETVLLPYLTRNIVTAESLTSGISCLVWPDRNMTDADGRELIHASKVIIFSVDTKENRDISGPASDSSLTDSIQLQR